jgi:hypothetical protein
VSGAKDVDTILGKQDTKKHQDSIYRDQERKMTNDHHTFVQAFAPCDVIDVAQMGGTVCHSMV